jgi:hypothetical protein
MVSDKSFFNSQILTTLWLCASRKRRNIEHDDVDHNLLNFINPA